MLRCMTIVVLTVCLPLQAAGPNLVPNGGFEKGAQSPIRWGPLDNLTLFLDRRGVSGRCIRMDTDVYRKEWEQNRQNPGSVRKKTRTSGKKYDTVGGSVGVALYSYPIPVESDAWYLVEYDVCGRGEPFVYLKGYRKVTPADARRAGTRIFFKPQPGGAWYSLMVMGGVGQEKHQTRVGDYAQAFRRRFVAKFAPRAKGEWHRVRGVVHLPKRCRVEKVLLELYGFWPPGDYFFDNVSMRKITPEEARRIQAERTKYSTPLGKRP